LDKAVGGTDFDKEQPSMDIVKDLQDMLLDVLSEEYSQSTEHLIEALSTELAEQFDELTAAYSSSYRLSKCGTLMSTVTLVSTALKDMVKQGLAERKDSENGSTFWRLYRPV
jgi:hypothetical protein